MISKYLGKTFIFVIFNAALLTTIQCSNTPAPELPKDIAGISVGMNKDNAQKLLPEIAVFERSEDKGQQVWRLKDNSRFVLLTLGYDGENKVRYVAAITNEKGSRKLRYADVGDLSRSQQNVSQGNYEYIWEVPENRDLPAYQVISHGNNPEYSMILTLKKTGTEDPEEEERERK